MLTQVAVTLVPVGSEHAPAMLVWMLEDEVRANVGVSVEPSMARTLAWIAALDESTDARAIMVDGRHVGNVVLDRIDGWKARLSIYLGERGSGYGRAAITEMVRVAFDEHDLGKVWLTVHARNDRAIAAYLACGFVVEGVHRWEFLFHGERLDELYMGILR